MLWMALISTLLTMPSRDDAVEVFTDCGGSFNSSTGYIHSPNFPGRFTVPISCRWLVHAPPGKRIILYFTQYYMREGIHISEYDFYHNESMYIGKTNLGQISFEDEITSIIAFKPVLMIHLNIRNREMGDIHLRVMQYLSDVYGFNMTYEVVDAEDSVRQDACSVYQCSFLGNCYASRDFHKYKCHCFDGYFGKECEYGPYCDPGRNINQCKNGGKCRYVYGSEYNTCDCPAGYEGITCEVKKYTDAACEKLGCNQGCEKLDAKGYVCTCFENYRMSDDNITCVERGRLRFMVTLLITNEEFISGSSSSLADVRKTVTKNFTREVTALLGKELTGVTNPSVKKISFKPTGILVEFHFVGEKSDKKKVASKLKYFIDRGRFGSYEIDRNTYSLKFDQALNILYVENYDKGPVKEGNLLMLVCVSRGSSQIKFSWLKDGAPINVHKSKRNIWETNLPKTNDDKYMAVLNIDKVTRIDKGKYSCIVDDWGDIATKSVHVSIIPKPHIDVSPKTTTVLRGRRPVTITCLSHDDKTGNFHYTWLRDGFGMEIPSENFEIVEKIFPTGSRLTIRHSMVTAIYTCTVKNIAGETSATSKISVISEEQVENCCTDEHAFDRFWPKTAPNESAVIRCPSGTRGFMSRYCSCLTPPNLDCRWELPDTSGCISHDLLHLRKKFRAFTLGYMTTSMPRVIQNLTTVTTDNRSLFTGDLILISKMLRDIYDYSSVEILNGLMPDGANLKNTEIGENILIVVSNVVNQMMESNIDVTDFTTDNIVFQGKRRHRVRRSGYSMARDEIEGSSSEEDVSIEIGDSAPTDVSIMIAEYTEMERIMPDNCGQERVNHTLLNSNVVSVIVANNNKMIPERINVTFTLYHHELVPTDDEHHHTCARWIHNPGEKGKWSSGDCIIVRVGVNSTRCTCYTPGHYVLLAPVFTPKVEVLTYTSTINLSLIIACVFSAAIFSILFVSHILAWEKTADNKRLFGTIFSLIIISIDVIIFVIVYANLHGVNALIVRLVLYFFHLCALSFVVVETARIHKRISSRTASEFGKIKFIATALVAPLVWLVAEAVLLGTTRHDMNSIAFEEKPYIERTNQSYLFIAICSLLVLLAMIFIGISSKVYYRVRLERKVRERHACMVSTAHVTVILIHVISVLLITVMVTFNEACLWQKLLAAMKISLAVFSVLHYFLIDNKVLEKRSHLKNGCATKIFASRLSPQMSRVPCASSSFSSRREMDSLCTGNGSSSMGTNSTCSTGASSVFKAFLKPQLGGSGEPGDSEVEYSVNRHQEKLSDEKREQLRQLIGKSWANPESDQSQETVTYWAAGVCKMYGVFRAKKFQFDKVKSYIVDDTKDDASSEDDEVTVDCFAEDIDETIGQRTTGKKQNQTPSGDEVFSDETENKRKRSVVINPFPDICQMRKCSGGSGAPLGPET